MMQCAPCNNILAISSLILLDPTLSFSIPSFLPLLHTFYMGDGIPMVFYPLICFSVSISDFFPLLFLPQSIMHLGPAISSANLHKLYVSCT